MELRKLIIFLLATGLIITGIYSSKNSFLLKTPHAPRGMMSLGFCSSNAGQSVILNEWSKDTTFVVDYSADSLYRAVPITALQTAIDQRTADFGFIFFYVALFTLLIYNSKANYTGFPSANVAFILILVAGVADVIGNLLELHSMKLILHNSNTTEVAAGVFITSCIKWLLVLVTLGFYYKRVLRPLQSTFLNKVNQQALELVRQLWNFRIVLIGLLVLFMMLSFVDQGEDLLVSIGDKPKGAALFVLGIFVLALLNWYLPKIYDDPANFKNRGTGYALDTMNIKAYLGRIMGSVTLLVPATGILSVMQTYHVPYLVHLLPPMVIFILVIFLYIGLLKHKYLDKIYMDKIGKFRESAYWLTFLFIFLIIAALALGIPQLISKLSRLSLIFFLLSFLFFLTVNYRVYFKNNFPFLPLLYAAACLIFLLFFSFNFRWVSSNLTRTERFYSLPVFIAGLVFYTLLFSGLLLLSKRYHFQFITSLLFLTVILSYSSVTKFHKVSLVPVTYRKDIKEEALRAYIHRWLAVRRGEIKAQSDQGRDYPVFFVNAYGGGIRAAAWTTMVVGRLNDLTRKDSSEKYDFEHYIFSYSGASGGTIGESMLAAARINCSGNPLKDTVFSGSLLMRVFKHDYLTNDIVGILGRDALMGSFGLSCYDDRAKVTEKAYEDYTCPLGISYDTVLRLGWHDKNMEVPLLVSNTFDVDNETKGILAPVRLMQSDFPGALLIQNLIDPKYDIHLSSAAFLSARFPYVSPTGKFDEKHHFTDGGTIENSGAETSLQLIRVFNSIVDSLTGPKGKAEDSIYKKVKICILSLPNSIPAIDTVDRIKNVYEMTAPIAGILGTVGGNADKAEAIMKDSAARYAWPYFKIFPMDAKISSGKIHPILPLGWQISDYALEMMDSTLVRKKSPIDDIIHLFRSNFRKKPIAAL